MNAAGVPERRERRPLRVVRLISFMTVGGVQQMLLTTLPEFDRERFELRVLCTARSGELGQRLAQRGIPVEVVRVRGRLHPAGIWRLARRLRALHPDIVHTHMYASNITGTVAARLAGVPVVVCHIHSDHEWRTWGRRRLERWCDPLRSGYLAVSEAVRRAFIERTGVRDPGERIRVLHNVPRPLNEAEGATVDPATLRAALGLAPGAPVVGTIARLAPVKGLDVLVRAAHHVARRVPDARWVIVGEGRERPALERLIRDAGLQGRVLLVGERTDVAAFYRLFDCLAISSRSEGCPNVLLESLAFGLPIVATRVGGVPELVRDGVEALLVPPEDPAALGDAVARVLTDGGLAARLGAAARAAAERFSVHSYVRQLEAYYEELVERRAAHRARSSRD